MTKSRANSFYPDTLSGHKEDMDGNREQEGDTVTIQEAAKRCGVSDKTIQRAIRAGKLLAHYPQSNRCEIAISDLDAFMHGQVSGQDQTAMESRLAALEERVRQLEALVQHLSPKQDVSKPRHGARGQERTTGPLPKQFVPLLAFAGHHNVPETRVQTHMEMGLLPVKRGEWIDADGAKVTLALDAKGRAAFYRVYHGVSPFAECKHCPH
jgi:excisionase family DNA binding protein